MGFLFAALLLGQTLFFMALLLSLGRPWGGIFPKKTAGTHLRRLAAGCVPVSMIPFIPFGSLPEAPLFWRGGLTKRTLPQEIFSCAFSISYADEFVKGK